jgi:tRNA(fMet)-specific endonuclease VapC
MPRFMLDTDTVSFALRAHGAVVDRLREHRPSELCISSVTLAELRYGAELKRSRKLHRLIDAFVGGVAVAPFDDVAARSFGRVAVDLVRSGRPIGTFDALIAAHALAMNLVLVSNNTKHFSRVAGLELEDWV